jgi:hypothetical protein
VLTENRVERDRRDANRRLLMLIGAAIAGLLIVSLFLEMVSSSPKASEERSVDAGTFK